MTEVRFLISWVPTAEVEKQCRAAGMKDGDGTSFWDWIAPEACQRTNTRVTFADAVALARQVLPLDVCGEVRIERQDLVNDRDDLGHVFKSKSWEQTASWHIHDPADSPNETAPDYRDAA
jgi:hypothetical protein